jgi:adenine-specific DNA-methyltransferase
MATVSIFQRARFSWSYLMTLLTQLQKLKTLMLFKKYLNSFVMDYYVTKTSVAIEGGYPCYQKNFH